VTLSLPQLREALMAWATEGPLRDELVSARAEFFKDTGEVRSDEPTFDAWMDAFVDWYLCERPLSALGTPVERFMKERQGVVPQEELMLYQAFRNTRRSLFKLEKVADGTLGVKDLLTDERLAISERRKPLGVNNGDLFDARILPVDGLWFFTGVPLFHPQECRRQVMRVVAHARKQTPQEMPRVLKELAIRRLRVDRYKRVEPTQLYADLMPKKRFYFW